MGEIQGSHKPSQKSTKLRVFSIWKTTPHTRVCVCVCVWKGRVHQETGMLQWCIYFHVSCSEDIEHTFETAEVKIEISSFWLSLVGYIVRSWMGVVVLEMNGVLNCDREIHHKCCLTAVAEVSDPISCTQETWSNWEARLYMGSLLFKGMCICKTFDVSI